MFDKGVLSSLVVISNLNRAAFLLHNPAFTVYQATSGFANIPLLVGLPFGR
jgi:hypothetical protein